MLKATTLAIGFIVFLGAMKQVILFPIGESIHFLAEALEMAVVRAGPKRDRPVLGICGWD